MDTTEEGKVAKESFSGKLSDLTHNVRKMKTTTVSELEKIFNEHEQVTNHLEAYDKDLKKREKELEERRKIDSEKKVSERAILLKTREAENALRLADEWKREKEELHSRITELERNLENAISEVVVLEYKLESIQNDLKDKEQEIEDQDCLIQVLITKERRSNAELQETRKELINFLMKDNKASIGVKRMGELDTKPFHRAVKREYTATELCSLWEDYMMDPNWHPFKIIPATGGHKEVLNEEDEKLNGLKGEFGCEVYEAMVTALTEINEYDPSGLCVIPELWNFKEERKATLIEGVSYILKQLKLHKRRRS